MSNEMDKIAAQIPEMLTEAGEHMQKLSELNVELVQERDNAVRELRLMKLARRMEERGIEPGLAFEAKVAKLASIDEAMLPATEQAIELAAGGFKLGHVSPDANTSNEKRSGDGGELYRRASAGDELDGFITNQNAYE